VPPEAAQTGAHQGLPADGGGVHRQPGTVEAYRRKDTCTISIRSLHAIPDQASQEERSKVDDLRGSPMSVGNLEEIIDDNHAIVSSSVGPEYYVSILSFVDKVPRVFLFFFFFLSFASPSRR
jgi:hypothetical protein